MSSASLQRPYNDVTARQEAFSSAYIQAVAAVAGCSIASPKPDNDKLDWLIGSRVRGLKFTKPYLCVQAKCLLSGLAEGEHIPYSLDIETYDNLRDEQVSIPRILVVVLAPKSFSKWLVQSEQQLAMSHCGYWLSLKGLPEFPEQDSRVVHLPRLNVFSPLSLQSMMTRISNGEDLSSVVDADELQ